MAVHPGSLRTTSAPKTGVASAAVHSAAAQSGWRPRARGCAAARRPTASSLAEALALCARRSAAARADKPLLPCNSRPGQMQPRDDPPESGADTGRDKMAHLQTGAQHISLPAAGLPLQALQGPLRCSCHQQRSATGAAQCNAFGCNCSRSTAIPQVLPTHFLMLLRCCHYSSRRATRARRLQGALLKARRPKAHQDAAGLRRRQRGAAPDQAHGAPERAPLVRQRGRLLAQLLPCALRRLLLSLPCCKPCAMIAVFS